MNLFKRKKKEQSFFERVLEDESAYGIRTKEESLDFLIAFFGDLRPAAKELHLADTRMKDMIVFLEAHPTLVAKLQQAILVQLINARLEGAFTESGIPLSSGFWDELIGKLKHKVLPKEQDKDDFIYVLDRVFYKKNDHVWIEAVRRSTWMSFFELLQFTLQAKDQRLTEHLIDALTVLSFQVANDGLEKEIAGYIAPFHSRQENPFLLQSRLLHELQQQVKNDPYNMREVTNRLKLVLFEIENEIHYIRQHQDQRGTSIRQSYLLLILSARIERMQILLDTIDNDDHFDIGRFVDLFKLLVRNENLKNSLRQFISQGVGYIAYQIAEHKGQKGGKYITTTRKDYLNMLISAMWGGLIICFVAVVKNILARLHYAYFWQGFWYSVNYSAGFVLIDQTGSTLATKQPAFTANAVAVSLDSKKSLDQLDLQNLALTVAKVIRSQTASFVGNLIIVFPGTYLLAWTYHQLMGQKLVEGKAAFMLLQEQHPFQSLSLLYACNTGVFLFLSGIIAGYVQNKIRFSNIGNRLTHHPGLHTSTSAAKRSRWAGFIEKNAGAYAGNISLGFFLGMAANVGKIFGVPFDIRHITISSGNMAIGVYGLGIANIPTRYLVTVFLGVMGIGFFNFLASFSLAFFVAVKSRGIQLRRYPELISIIVRHFFKKPLSFIIPPKNTAQQ
ncbi:site-specific recombinase [Niabella beijingensis]|uniref:site-specific recombinase n=1 Tax=Niabella beijingensis TaxID=2872700 RepID=UPI001CBF3B27|nr:site-specific recombinase [Niabella beijingensis]MBZ4188014.1 site-specific recombinase [Niabella beijingensis]